MVTIIIPVLNEEKTIEKCLQNIIELPGQKELIVVDGGSLDNTVGNSEPLCTGNHKSKRKSQADE